jgi:hypothetical protein
VKTEHRKSGRPLGILGIFLGLAALISLASACYVAVREPVHEVEGLYTDETVVVSDAPPPVQSEVIVGVAPGPNYIWVGGYWARHGSSWFWVRGRWTARPSSSAVWVEGRWDRHPRGYVWVRGHWR